MGSGKLPTGTQAGQIRRSVHAATLDKAQSYVDRLVRVNPADERISGIRITLADKREACQASFRGPRHRRRRWERQPHR